MEQFSLLIFHPLSFSQGLLYKSLSLLRGETFMGMTRMSIRPPVGAITFDRVRMLKICLQLLISYSLSGQFRQQTKRSEKVDTISQDVPQT
jgi:hypothetical protein